MTSLHQSTADHRNGERSFSYRIVARLKSSCPHQLFEIWLHSFINWWLSANKLHFTRIWVPKAESSGSLVGGTQSGGTSVIKVRSPTPPRIVFSPRIPTFVLSEARFVWRVVVVVDNYQWEKECHQTSKSRRRYEG